MRSAIARVTLKIIELLSCIACFVTKVITDLEARRVFLRSQKYSREWSLLHNITWSSAGNTFANITYGGFSLITALMLISRCIDANSSPSIIEKIFLVVGMLCFFAMGGLVLAAYDQVPWELHDNSIILGCLSFFVALVMMYDLSDPIARYVTDTTQTDNENTPSSQHHHRNHRPTVAAGSGGGGVATSTATDSAAAAVNNPSGSNQTNQSTQFDQSNIPTDEVTGRNGMTDKSVQAIVAAKPIEKIVTQTQTQTVQTAAPPPSTSTVVERTMYIDDIAQNGNYHRGDTIDFVQYQHMPPAEQPVFERVLLPEKKRPTYNKVADPHKATVVQNVIRSDGYIPRETHFDSTVNYNQMPTYAAIQRQHTQTQTQTHQQYQHQHQQHQHQPQTPSSSSSLHQTNLDYASSYAPTTPMYKLNRSYEADDYERPPPTTTTAAAAVAMPKRGTANEYGRSPSNHHTVVKTMRMDEPNRHHYHHHDAISERYQNQPMMVIRNYGHSNPIARTSTTPTAAAAVQSGPAEQRRYQHSTENVYHRNGNNGTRKSNAYITHANSSRNNGNGGSGGGGGGNRCCGPNTDDEVDFRKMNASIRPGFVASVAKMWDQRAVENAGEFNTIV